MRMEKNWVVTLFMNKQKLVVLFVVSHSSSLHSEKDTLLILGPFFGCVCWLCVGRKERMTLVGNVKFESCRERREGQEREREREMFLSTITAYSCYLVCVECKGVGMAWHTTQLSKRAETSTAPLHLFSPHTHARGLCSPSLCSSHILPILNPCGKGNNMTHKDRVFLSLCPYVPPPPIPQMRKGAAASEGLSSIMFISIYSGFNK